MRLKKNEIEIIADDIKNNINQTIQITKFSIVAATAILAYSIGKGAPNIFSAFSCLLPIPILMISINMVLNRRQNVMEKATYLRNFGGKYYLYELFLRKLREKVKNGDYIRSSFSETLFNMLVLMIYISIASSFIIALLSVAQNSSTLHEIYSEIIEFRLRSICLGILLVGLVVLIVWFNYYKKQKLFELKSVIMGPKNEGEKLNDKEDKPPEDVTAKLWEDILEEVRLEDSKRIPE